MDFNLAGKLGVFWLVAGTAKCLLVIKQTEYKFK